MALLRMLSAALIVFAAVTGAAMLLQREAASALRTEIDLLREDQQRLARLRAEHERLKAAQVPDAELDRLRSDHAALVRLRAEIASLKARADEMAREEARAASMPDQPATPHPRAALALRLVFGPDGNLSLDGAPIDLSVIKKQFAELARGDHVELRLRSPDSSPPPQFQDMKQEMKQTIGQIVAVANEFGLKIAFQTQGPKTIDE